MKDTIASSSVYNRKIILEVRYEPDPYIIDKRGKLLKELKETKVIADPKWSITDGSVMICDSDKPQMVNKLCQIDSQRFVFSVTTGFTNDSFLQNFDKLFAVVCNNLDIAITRIGCRIQGTYATKSNDYDSILKNFLTMFPNQLILEDFHPRDFHFLLLYENGQYQIGPTKEKDIWFLQNFPNEETRNSTSGFAVDTDNYILKDATNTINKTSTKDVFKASISVEKLLFEKLNAL